VIKNDSQITRITAEKRFGDVDRVVGEIIPIV
jgi:Holliday junction resolvase RusA-like endonuclease